jgi:hypothetical protein
MSKPVMIPMTPMEAMALTRIVGYGNMSRHADKADKEQATFVVQRILRMRDAGELAWRYEHGDRSESV